MKILFGIGNPGTEYADTRHNIGFIVLDRFAERQKVIFKPGRGDYFQAVGNLSGHDFVLVKPTTYVNRSGIAATEIFERFGISLDDFLVITDDVNLDFGKIRIRPAGSDGGHNGLASIIYHLADNHFPRLRFGIGRNFEAGEMANYVLSPFTEEERQQLPNLTDFAVDILEQFVLGGFQQALDFYSRSMANKKQSGNEGAE